MAEYGYCHGKKLTKSKHIKKKNHYNLLNNQAKVKYPSPREIMNQEQKCI